MNNYEKYCTDLVQSIGSKEGAVSSTITPSASFSYTTAQNAEAIFSGSIKKPLYARMGNPTTVKLESR